MDVAKNNRRLNARTCIKNNAYPDWVNAAGWPNGWATICGKVCSGREVIQGVHNKVYREPIKEY